MTRSWFVYVIRLRDGFDQSARDHVIAKLRERGIGCQAYFPPIHEQPYMYQIVREQGAFLPLTEGGFPDFIALPFFSSMQEEEVVGVCDVFPRNPRWHTRGA